MEKVNIDFTEIAHGINFGFNTLMGQEYLDIKEINNISVPRTVILKKNPKEYGKEELYDIIMRKCVSDWSTKENNEVIENLEDLLRILEGSYNSEIVSIDYEKGILTTHLEVMIDGQYEVDIKGGNIVDTLNRIYTIEGISGIWIGLTFDDKEYIRQQVTDIIKKNNRKIELICDDRTKIRKFRKEMKEIFGVDNNVEK